jgi:16S rRNA (adenine1518-N6/adenine1519-N6)-dimethyltransferase
MIDLTDKNSLITFLRSHHLFAKKSWDQHFLINKEILHKVVESAQLTEKDTVVEIGPGVGTLTYELIKNAGLVIAIEKDRNLARILKLKMFGFAKDFFVKGDQIVNCKLKIIVDNAVFAIPRLILPQNYKVVANLPYGITSPVIRLFFEKEPAPEMMVLMVQKEVAERLVAKPGDSNRGFLTLLVEMYGQAEIVQKVPASSFWPVPKVESAIIRVQRTESSDQQIKKEDQEKIIKLAKIGFAHKRQQIHNALKSLNLPQDKISKIFKKARIDGALRAEDLSLEDWRRLKKTIEFYSPSS